MASSLSVVSIFHNRAAEVDVSVQSLLDQSHPNYTVLLWDDGSTDGTLAKLQAFAGPKVKVTTAPNQGFTAAISTAIGLTDTDYVAIHGAGDVSLPDRLLLQARYLDEHPAIGFVGCRVERTASDRPVFRPRQFKIGQRIQDQLLVANPFTHGEVMFRRSLYDQVGGYRPAFRLAQDLDLWLRFSERAEAGLLDELLYVQRPSPGSVGLDPGRLVQQAQYSELARQCLEERRRGQSDSVARLGDEAYDIRARSPRLASRLFGRGLRWRVYWNDYAGLAALAAARAEGLAGAKGWLYSLATAPANSLLWRGFRLLLRAKFEREEMQGRRGPIER